MSLVIIKVYVCTVYNAMLIQRINFVDMYVYFYVCMHIFLSVCLSLSLPLSLSLTVCVCVCLSVYIYTQTDRHRHRDIYTDRLCVSVSVCIYIYIFHIYIWKIDWQVRAGISCICMRGLVGGWAGGGRDRYYRLYLGIHSQSSAVFKCFTKQFVRTNSLCQQQQMWKLGWEW